MKLLPKDKYSGHETAVLLLWALFFNLAPYNGARLFTKNWHHFDMTTALDGLVPFVPWTVLIYFGCYIFWAISYYTVALGPREDRYRFFCGVTMAKILSFVIFLAIPTTNVRPELAGELNIFERIMEFLYTIDSADNLFPSFHCLVSWFCWVGVRKRPDIPAALRVCSLVIAIAICISTLTTKQHVIADVIISIAMAEGFYLLAGIKKITAAFEKTFTRLFCIRPKAHKS